MMALDDPEHMIGLHLTNLDVAPYTGPGSRPLSLRPERCVTSHTAVRVVAGWRGGYKAIQSTRPQTLGLRPDRLTRRTSCWGSWKWRLWSDSGGDLDRRFPSGHPPTTVHAVLGDPKQSARPIRDYYYNRWHCGDDRSGRLRPRADRGRRGSRTSSRRKECRRGNGSERPYNVRRFTPMPRGGHFVAGRGTRSRRR